MYGCLNYCKISKDILGFRIYVIFVTACSIKKNCNCTACVVFVLGHSTRNEAHDLKHLNAFKKPALLPGNIMCCTVMRNATDNGRAPKLCLEQEGKRNRAEQEHPIQFQNCAG